jgi:DNA-binding transcriptional LysR family regulator
MIDLEARLNPRAFDVQLLLVFDALLTERHVTNAARRLGLSQSAVSHALQRLRAHFDDPILVRTTKGMQPTARALELAEPVRDALRQVETVFSSKPNFVPYESEERFVIRIGDTNEFQLLPALLKELAEKAPKVSLVVRHLPPVDTVQGLEEGAVDFAIGAFLQHPKSIHSLRLADDRMICALAKTHPMAHKRLTLDAFLSLRQIRVSQDGGDTRFVDDALRADGLERQVVAITPHLLAGLHTVLDSSVAMAVPERMARAFDWENKLVLHELPVGGKRFEWKLYWHRRQDSRPAQRWMRELVTSLYGRV